jgi:hypothetical protein
VQPLASTGRAANLTFRLGVAIAIAAYLITPKMNRATAAPGDQNRCRLAASLAADPGNRLWLG